MRLFSPVYAPWGLAASALMVAASLLLWGQTTGAVHLSSGFRLVPVAMLVLGVGFVLTGLAAMFAAEGFPPR